jgi:hypothetical protein
MEQVVTRWWHPVTSGEVLVMLHKAMRSRLHRRTAMAIGMACNGGAFIRRRRNCSSRLCHGPLTLIVSYIIDY